MESIYYVLSWLCHRRCRHCYEERFRPYVRSALAAVVAEAQTAFPRIVDNLPETMIYRDRAEPLPGGGHRERVGRIILSGGEVLLDPVRETVLYPVLERLRARYAGTGGARIVVQTTGDRVSERILDELLARGVWMVSVAGMDDFHVGMEGAKRVPLQERLTGMFERAGMRRSGYTAGARRPFDEDGPVYGFFGATPDAWIGKLWPRGRAWRNDLSTAAIEDNFCNRWSGGLDFLRYGYSGAEVSIEPDGNVYPCCIKTAAPLGNLTEERLVDIIASLQGHPAFEAIAAGRPERMGLELGWSEAEFLRRSETTTPGGRTYRNLCIGCDAFHREVLGAAIAEARHRRLGLRARPAAE